MRNIGTTSEGSQGGAQFKILSYNLFWWNLFGKRNGNGKSAGKLIARSGPYDIMGFQECDDVQRVLRDAGLQNSHAALPGGHALAIAYRRAAWHKLDSGTINVAEDRRDQYYGNRAVNWARLRHISTGKVVLFVNHHGPLPVNSGGKDGGESTARNILRVIGEQSQNSNLQILVGDLNADRHSRTQQVLQQGLKRVFVKWVDAIFASKSGFDGRDIGKGGSDHDAIEATFQI